MKANRRSISPISSATSSISSPNAESPKEVYVRENKKKQQPIEGEIVSPAQLDLILGKSQDPGVPQLDAILERFDQLLGESLKVLDLDTEEGWRGESWGGMDDGIPKKTER